MALRSYIKIWAFIFVFGLVNSCSNDDDDNGATFSATQFVDPRDGQTYDIVTIGTQTWFAENLNYDLGDNSSVCYFLDDTNCFIYGRLYEGDVAQTACPEGWHLPSVEEYETLFDYLGGIETVHVFLAPFAHQQGQEIGFNLLAAGRHFGDWFDLGEIGYYYTSTPGGFPNSYRNMIYYKNNDEVTLTGVSSSGLNQSCRCIKD